MKGGGGLTAAAKVAVEGATFSFDKWYDYAIPEHLRDAVRPGSVVLVPFGRGRARPRTGVVLAVEPAQREKPLKALYDAAPEGAQLTPELLELVQYLREHTFCTYYDAVRAVIPYGAQYRPKQGPQGPYLERQLKVRTVSCYRLSGQGGKLTAKQQQVASLLEGGRVIDGPVLCEGAGVGPGVLKTMVKNGVLLEEKREKKAELFHADVLMPAEGPIELSEEQAACCRELIAMLKEDAPRAALLHGVTGSGKTLVFLQLIREAQKQGRTSLVLVPEIGLTPQMIGRMKAAFGDRVAVQHSALSNTERLQQWQQIQRGEAQVVVGTRSAVFAPLENLGLIIIDEEQEHTYVSENSPRYSALEVAKQRASYHKGLLVLASATPSVEDYYFARQGRYRLLQMEKRYNALPLPKVELVDLRGELAAGNVGQISGRLAQEIAKNLAGNEQTILLLNRRGYNTAAVCRDCGETIKCSLCSVPMVYHKKEGRLQCHYCGGILSPAPQRCPVCGGEIRYSGTGTQRIEEELQARFPTARVLRMDMDTTQGKNSHEKLLSAFARGEYDILVGTQMVAKGLDFPRVSLVGVLGIDQLLFAQSYRALERVFSLVTQVVGRGGRAGLPGRALIQTADPGNRVLALAAAQDYPAFYEEEIAFRRLHLYPPFCALCIVTFSCAQEPKAASAARDFGLWLRQEAAGRQELPLRILGPAPANLAMLHGKYRYKLTVKCRNDAAFRQAIRRVQRRYSDSGYVGEVSVAIDFNSDSE